MKILRISVSVLFLAVFSGFQNTDSDQTGLLQKILGDNGISLWFSINQYDYDFHNQLTQSFSLKLLNQTNSLKAGQSEWKIEIVDPSVDKEGEIRFKVKCSCIEGNIDGANLSVDFRFSKWSVKNYVLLPACAYNGNRFESRRIPYSPKLYDPRDIGIDKPIIISDVPRLNIKEGPSSMSLRSGDLSSPVIGIQSPELNKGYLIHFNPTSRLGDNGLKITENRARNEAIISVTAPVVREKTIYKITDNQADSRDIPAKFVKNDIVEFEFAFNVFEAKKIQALFDRLFENRYSLTGEPELKPVFPFSSCFAVQEKKFNEQNYVPEYGYYAVGMRENYSQDWQVGWVGGMITTYPLLFAGNRNTKENVIRNFDWLFPDGIAPSGFFWDAGKDGTIWYGGDQRKFHTKNWHLIRKSCDALYYVILQFELMKKLGIPVKESWENGTRKVADSFVELWNKYHQFGQFVNSITGEIEVGGSTSAALAPAALVSAFRYFKDDRYLNVAVASADSMYRKYISIGITCGGPGDALQNPDSESSYAMLQSFISLYECTRDEIWLARAREMAHQFATWVMTYNYNFPPQSLFGRLGMQTAGTVWANTQNKHSAPGICTHSGVALLRLYRATGDERYLKLLRHIAFTLPQYLSHPLRPIQGLKEGWINERVNTTDWLEGIGEIFIGSTWAETSMMLTYVEIPGLYIVPEKNLCVAFDNIESTIIKSNNRLLQVEIYNPTKAEASVKILVDHTRDFKIPLDDNYLLNSQSITLKPGQREKITIKKSI